MVKGVTRQIILVDPPDPELFEKAIFILREGCRRATSEQLLAEAQEIADSYLRGTLLPGTRLWKPLLCALSGALLTGAVWLITSVL